jgi:3-dehydrosphinganine reductase
MLSRVVKHQKVIIRKRQDMITNKKNPNTPFEGTIILVSGGSKGIGKETAKELARLGGSVCIVARGEDELEKAADEVRRATASSDQFVETITCDATNESELRPLLDAFVMERGVPDYLLNVVGYAYPQYLTELSLDDFKKNMDVNYYGQLVPTLLLLPHMLSAGKGHISFVSSIASFLGLVGYASYTPTKAALVGLVEVLRHELKPKNISVSVLYPPDTDTPGFEEENKTKPQETALLSETAKLLTPQQVAKRYVEGLQKKKMHILVGDAWWIWRLFRWFPGLAYAIMDQDYKKVLEKLGK